jgi:hypothetical protein
VSPPTPGPSPASGRGGKGSARLSVLSSVIFFFFLLPLPVSPLPLAGEGPGVGERLANLLHQAETWRGLTAKHPVASRTLAETDLAAAVAAAIRKDLPPGEMHSLEAALKAFGLVPESLDLAVFLPKLLTGEIAGYYDPETKALSLVRRSGSAPGAPAEDMVLVHELTHALQDQYFDLAAFAEADPLSDAAAARQALVEGDATLTMLSAALGKRIEDLEGAEKLLAAAGSLDMPGSPELAAAPPYLRETLLFSYVQGNLFCLRVRQAGGQALLDRAFRSDPPRSTEQILHPEKWIFRRDDPVAVEVPDLAAALPGFVPAAEGDMGELAVRILLREGLKDEARATAAAAGWGGDRFAVYEKDGRRLLAWVTAWDSAADAAEFATAARQLGADWHVEQPSARRVTVLRGASQVQTRAIALRFTQQVPP